MIDLLSSNEFNFWLPMELSKSEKGSKASGKRWIEGIASTLDKDLQSETVDQRGIDFSYFLKYGYFNNDHKPGFDNKVGQPSECKIQSKGLWTKGFLFKNHKIADAIWELAHALEISLSDRKLGFSIQGKVLRRAGRRILRCWIQDIAVTTAPINTNTWLDVVKSLSEVPDDMWCSPEEEYTISPRLISPIAKSTCSTCQKHMSSKAFPLAIDESEMDLKKRAEQKEDEEKALSSNSPAAQVESLEGNSTDLDWAGSEEKTKKSMEAHFDKPLGFDECVNILSEYRQLPRPEARVVAKAVFEMNGLST